MVNPHLRKILAEIVHSNEILQNLVSSNFFLVDYANQTSSMSKIMQQAGLGTRELQENQFYDHLHPDDLQTYRSLWQRLWSGLENEMLVEYRLRCHDGHYIWARTQCLVIKRLLDGSPSLLVGLDSDISARKVHESNLQDELDFYKARLLQYEHLREA